MQACTWTEYIQDSSLLEYNDFPRLAALSERAWSKEECKDYDNFLQRLNSLLICYDNMQVNYSKSHFAVNVLSEKKKNKIILKLSSPLPDATIYYTLDGKDPSTNSKIYNKPISLDKSTILKAFAYKDERHFSPVFEADYNINKATGKKYEMLNINPQYNGGSTYALTDGLKGNKKSFERWVGTMGKDYEVILDLEQKEKINSVSINFLDEEGSWVFLPTKVEIFVSNDKKNWLNIGELSKQDVEDNPKVVNYKTTEASFQTKNNKYRYVKIFAKSIGLCPENHPGKGYPAHTFADEIEIN